jgi:hypothetical protein
MVETKIHISERQLAELEAAEQREDRPRDEIVQDALDRYFEEHQRRLPQSIGIIEDHEVNSTNFRDWLRENWHPE